MSDRDQKDSQSPVQGMCPCCRSLIKDIVPRTEQGYHGEPFDIACPHCWSTIEVTVHAVP